MNKLVDAVVGVEYIPTKQFIGDIKTPPPVKQLAPPKQPQTLGEQVQQIWNAPRAAKREQQEIDGSLQRVAREFLTNLGQVVYGPDEQGKRTKNKKQ